MEIQNLENQKLDLQIALQNAERKIAELQMRFMSEHEMDSFNTRDVLQNPMFAEMQQTVLLYGISFLLFQISKLEKQLNEKQLQINQLNAEQATLKEENSKLKLSIFKLESQRSDSVNPSHFLKDSNGNTVRSSYENSHLEEGLSSKTNSEGGWEKFLSEKTETFTKNLDDANLSSKYLKERVKMLQRTYGEFIPKDKSKY